MLNELDMLGLQALVNTIEAKLDRRTPRAAAHSG
jgi:hypothetical protein